jgi:AraC family transcriptional activator of tynA and feaB
MSFAPSIPILALIAPQPDGACMSRFPETVDFNNADAFQSGLRPVCGQFIIVPRRKDGCMHARLGLAERAGYEIAQIGLDAMYTERDKRSIRADPSDNMFLIFQQIGQAVMYQDGTRVMLNEGDIFFCDSSRPARFEFGGHYTQQTSLHIRRAEAVSRFGARLRTGICLKRDDSLSLAMRSIMQRVLFNTPHAQPQTQLMDTLFSSLGAVLTEIDLGATDARGDGSHVLDAALHEISVQYADPALRPTELAERIGVSLRSLQRAFQQIDETPRQRIASVRLERAYQKLQESGKPYAKQTVTDIAFSCGFNDLSYFYREFRQRFKITPGEVQAQIHGRGRSIHPRLSA